MLRSRFAVVNAAWLSRMAEPLNGCVIDITYSDSFSIRNGRSRLVNCRSQMSERRFHVLTCQGDSECVYGDFTPTTRPQFIMSHQSGGSLCFVHWSFCRYALLHAR